MLGAGRGGCCGEGEGAARLVAGDDRGKRGDATGACKIGEEGPMTEDKQMESEKKCSSLVDQKLQQKSKIFQKASSRSSIDKSDTDNSKDNDVAVQWGAARNRIRFRPKLCWPRLALPIASSATGSTMVRIYL